MHGGRENVLFIWLSFPRLSVVPSSLQFSGSNVAAMTRKTGTIENKAGVRLGPLQGFCIRQRCDTFVYLPADVFLPATPSPSLS